MRINPLRRKPGWESRDAAERARAVAQATLAELGAHLPELVRNDVSPDVRRAALRRLDDLSLLADRMRHDEHDAVRDAARIRYKEVLVEAARAVAERERMLHVEDDQDVLAHVATHALETPLRRIALERVTRTGLLVDRCQRDPDAGIRLWLLSRIESPATLERIAESVRKSDKLLARVARERLEALKLAAGDPATLRARALSICDQLDALRRERPADSVARREALAAHWGLLRERVDEAMVRRVAGYFAALDPRQAAADLPVADASVDATSAADTPGDADGTMPQAVDSEPANPAEPVPDEGLAAAASLEAERAQADQREREQERARRDAERVHERERRDAERVAIAELLAALEITLAEGKLAAARPAHAALAAARAATGSVGRELAERIGTVESAYEKLVRWQHWSNNKVRSRLCAETEALASSGLHPDAVATKVKELQVAWQHLDESEAIAADAPDSGIAKRFRGACHRALAPTRKYFEKRRELRGQKREEVEGLVTEVERGLDTDPRAAPSLRRRVVAALQQLDELDPRARAAQGRKLRALLARFDELKLAVAGEAEAEKRKLIANLRREVARAPLDEAIEKAKHAQGEWKRIGPATREVDEALREELKALIDPLFEKAGAERSAEEQARNAQQTDARAILDELAALANDNAHQSHADARIAALTQRWRALPRPTRDAARDPRAPGQDRGGRGDRGGRSDRGPAGGRDARSDRGSVIGRDARDARGGRPDRGAPPARDPYDERGFDKAIERVRETMRESGRAAERTALVSLRDAAAICARIEDARIAESALDADTESSAFDALVIPPDAKPEMRARFDAALAMDGAAAADALAANEETGEQLAVRAELVAGVPSPPAASALRKRHQLERLAARMRGEIAAEARDEARELLLQWCALGPLAPDARDALGARIETAMQAVAL